MKKISLFAVMSSALVMTSCSTSKVKLAKGDKMKSQVVELLNSIESGDQKPVSYINPQKYIQHNLGVKDGLAGFGEVLSQLPPNSAKVDVKRVFRDGNFVVAHTKYNFFGPKAGIDIFRYENGKIVEHWDNLQEIVTNTVSGRTQFDGPTEVVDIEKTQDNKKLVKGFLEDVLLGKNPSKITEYISTEKYHQHNPAVGDGLEGLGKAIEELNKVGLPMIYEKNHMILGEGNFVLTVSEGTFMKKNVAFYDIFRVENDKIVEHWDTIQEIPAKRDWQNNNGKF